MMALHMEYKRHPLSAAWGDMAADDFEDLQDSIYHVGQLRPIILFEDQVLDGWQRLQACRAKDIPPKFEQFPGGDPIEYVRAEHTRRPATSSQRAIAYTLMSQWAPSGGAGHESKCADAAHSSAAQIADKAGVSVRTIVNAKATISQGIPAVVKAVQDGDLAIDRAAEIAKLPKDEQAAAIKAPRSVKPRGTSPKGSPTGAARARDNAAQHDADAATQPTQSDARIGQLEQQIQALKDELADAHDHIATMTKVFESNDEISAALVEVAAARKLERGYKDRINSMTTQIGELKGQVAYYKKKLEAVA